MTIIAFLSILLIFFFSLDRLELSLLWLYYIISIVVCFLLLTSFSIIILTYFLDLVNEPLVVSDPLEFIYHCLCFIFELTVFIVTPFWLFIFFLYTSSIYYRYNYLTYIFIIILFVYYLELTFWVSKDDLFFSNWSSMKDIKYFSKIFDLQINFEKFLSSFWFEFRLFFLFWFFLEFLPFVLLLIGLISYFWGLIYGYIYVCIEYIIYNYFFYEYSILNNFIVLLLFLLFFYIFKMLWLIFLKSKYYKYE